jgi:16S rRNA (cytidine1402-2'-O)-methyltransferase
MLYIVATPLGNLSDISERAKRTLAEVNLIIAENPAYTRKLVEGTGKRYIQLADHNEAAALPKILKELVAGTDAALVSDAGTPGISDPGFKLVREAVALGVTVSPIPGPSAAIAALSAAGLPTDKFLFLGFVPKTEVKLVRELEAAEAVAATAVFYESPQRVAKTIGYIAAKWPNAKVCVARELTKIHEEFVRGTATEVLANLKARASIKGEITVLVSFK